MPNPQLIKTDEELERVIVETVIQDLAKAEEVRTRQEYGTNDKGVAYTFETRLKSLRDMWSGKREPKDVPWKFCSNRSMKIGMAILEMMHARVFSAIWNEDLISWKPTEITDREKVERINKFMNWWIRVKVKMRDFIDKWVKVCLSIGTVYTETSWNVEYVFTGEVDETPIVDEFGIPVMNADGTPITKAVQGDVSVAQELKNKMLGGYDTRIAADKLAAAAKAEFDARMGIENQKLGLDRQRLAMSGKELAAKLAEAKGGKFQSINMTIKDGGGIRTVAARSPEDYASLLKQGFTPGVISADPRIKDYTPSGTSKIDLQSVGGSGWLGGTSGADLVTLSKRMKNEYKIEPHEAIDAEIQNLSQGLILDSVDLTKLRKNLKAYQ
jgi:hypothetical protein